jgi:RNA polymerase sigma-70 factor (ECF subfamily)
MADESTETRDLLRRAGDGDQHALGDLFRLHRSRLRRMVQLRLDQRLQGRVDPSDVIQEAYVEALSRLNNYLEQPDMPLFLWLRLLVGQQLTYAHRKHLGTKKRDAGREVSICREAYPEASSAALAAHLVGRVDTPSVILMRADRVQRIQQALESMSDMDREVLTLRHFEQLSRSETARVLDIEESAASKRYVRALRRLKKSLGGAVDGLEEL